MSAKKKAQPGPGEYSMRHLMGYGAAKATMPGRRKDLRPKTGLGVPSGGEYDPSYGYSKLQNPRYSMSNSKRDGQVSIFHNNPAPDKYFDYKYDKLIKSQSATWR